MGRLTDKYCIVGVGETAYTKDSGRTTRSMAVEAVRNAMRDAGLQASQVNGMLALVSIGDAAGLLLGASFFTSMLGRSA